MVTADQRHTALIDSLIRSGELTDDHLITAFRATPRHVFIPETGARTAHGVALDARADPDHWFAAVYTDDAIITGADVGDPDGGRLVPTSASSAPTIMARMLQAADLRAGHRVLEIGTGTGWNAALLAARLGAGNVTSVEIDPGVLERARTALAISGHRPELVVGDGERGHPPGAPYDRTIATHGVARIPRAWVEQTAPGGLVVAPWTAMEGVGGLARLTVTGDGSASGRFRGGLGNMGLRSRRPAPAPPNDLGWRPEDVRRVAADPTAPLADFRTAFPLTFMVPAWRMGTRRLGAEEATVFWLSATDGGSWARAYASGGEWTIEQGGSRSLWDELDAARTEWRHMGAPDPDRFGLTVTPEGRHRVWLDSPDGRSWDLRP